ncbi:MAG: GAF domain-containing protein [Nitrospinae bacterium]|nr:GAF domain-containing protein [Nitrospinota bacterium]
MIDQTLSLEILRDVAQIATSTLDLDYILNRIIEVIKNKMRIDACAIYLFDEGTQRLNLRASSGLPMDKISNVSLEMGKGITGWVAQNKVTLALSEALRDPRFVYFPEIEEEKYKSMLSVPVVADSQCIGVVNVHTLQQRDFPEMEISLLETISHQVSGCIRNAAIYTKSQMLLKELTILYDVGMAVQSAPKLEYGLWIILSGLTRGEAGGFNRAMLFMLNEKTQMFQGVMGLGPDSPDDAQRIWTALSQKSAALDQWMVTEADNDQYNRSAFNAYVKTLRIPFRPGENVLSEALAQRKTVNVKEAQNDPQVPRDFINALGVNAFAVAPLTAREENLGVILVDNRYNYKPIAENSLRLLSRFAIHASWTIENSRLFARLLETNKELLSIKEQLIDSEKLSALGELSAEVAHEIKNPLVSIGGFARRLKDRIVVIEKDPSNHSAFETAANYANIIVNEVERLENLLKNILIYSKPGELQLDQCVITGLLDDVIVLFQSGFYEQKIDFHCNFPKDLQPVYIDRQKMKQVLINLVYNAIESMPNGGALTIDVYPGPDNSGQEVLTVSVKDTGGGIPPEVFANIFNPFFTTKNHGTGLGLSVCRKIVESHGGIIRVENNIGNGVTVFIHLPLQIVCDYTKN